MAKYNGSGWHFQTIRHSNARKYGKAGGKYSTQMNITHSETKSLPRYKQLPIYNYDEASKELKEKILNNYRDINVVDVDWWDFDGLFDPTTEDFKKLGRRFKHEYDEDTKKGYSTLNNFKIESFDLDRENYLQIKDIDTKNKSTFLKQIGLTEEEIILVDKIGVNNDRENDSKIIIDFYNSNAETEKAQDRIQSKAEEGFSELIHRAKKELREQYKDLISDEAVKNTIQINEYDFDEQGKMVSK